MKVSDFLVGRKAPAPGVVPRSAASVRGALLALDRDRAPYTVRIAAQDERAESIAEWRIADARWHGVLAGAGLEKTCSILMRLEEASHEVRIVEMRRCLEWRAGVPVVTGGLEVTFGRRESFEFGTAYAFTEEPCPGEVYRYKFNAAEIKRPLEQAVIGKAERGAAPD